MTLSVSDYVTTSSLDIYSESVSNMLSLDFITTKVHPFKLYILAVSNNGLVLCSTTEHHHTKLYVCNPLLKQYVMLPKVLSYKVSVFLGLICESSSTYSGMGYKVVRIPQFCRRKRNFKIEIYSSDLDKWSSYEVSVDQAVSMPECLQRKFNMIEICGVLYWNEGRQGNSILALDVKNSKTEDTGGDICDHRQEVVKPGGEKCLTEFEGSIACIYYDTSQASIWVLQDDDETSNGWIRCFRYTWLFRYTSDHIFRPLAFDSTTQNIVILEIFCSSKTYYIRTYNIKNGNSKKDRVANTPNNSPQLIKAFVLPLLPTPVSATRLSS